MKCSTHLRHSGEQINKIKPAHLAVIHEGRSLKARQQAQNRVAYAYARVAYHQTKPT